MSASTNDKLTDTRNAARPNSARVTSGRSAGGATLACDNLSGWPTTSKVHFVTYKIDSNSAVVAGTQLDCYGIVSGNNIGSFNVVDGTDTGHAVGDVVEMLPTAAWGQDLADALTVGHTRAGAHVANLPLTTPTLTTPTIASFTNANHDHSNSAGGGQLNGANAITDGTITPAELTVGTGSSWAWQTYTPTWTGSGSNPSIGNGILTGYYTQIGKTVIGRIYLQWGTTTSNGTGTQYFSLPVTGVTTNMIDTVTPMGTATLLDTGIYQYAVYVFYHSSTTILLRHLNAAGSGTFVGTSGDTTWAAPFAPGSTDTTALNFTYEAA